MCESLATTTIIDMIEVKHNTTITSTNVIANEIQKGNSSMTLLVKRGECRSVKRTIRLPKPQVYGTGMQCRQYSIESAKRIISKLLN